MPASAEHESLLLLLASFATIIFFGYAGIGLPLAALASFVHQVRGFNDVVVGLVVALQSVATLLTRPVTGRLSDERGGRFCVFVGVAFFLVSGGLYLGAALVTEAFKSLWILLAARVFTGIAESFVMTGALSWCVAAVGPRHAGRAMVWAGIAMYSAVAVGAPFGLFLMSHGGFAALALAAIIIPLAGGAVALVTRPAHSPAGKRVPFFRVLGAIWRQGTGLALSSAGFSVMGSFAALYFQAHHWGGVGLALAIFGGAFIVARLFLGHLPDKLGGDPVLLPSLLVEAAGLFALWAASSPTVAMIGAFLVGAGQSLVFPAFGVIVIRRVPAQSRGSALGAYVVFFDVGLAVSAPVAGALTGRFGYPSIYAAAGIAVLASVIFALRPGRVSTIGG